MGVFWNNKRRRIDATYPYATVVFSGTPVAGDVVSFSIGGGVLLGITGQEQARNIARKRLTQS